MKTTEQQNGSESNKQETTPCGPADNRHHHPTGTTRQRQKLMDFLDECGVSAAGFEALRKDAYEKMVAAESPENLEVVYEALLDPALGLAEVREKCPVWPAGSRNAGKLPSLMTLRDIKARILLDWSIQEKLSQQDFAGHVERMALTPEKWWNAIRTLLLGDFMGLQMEGGPLNEKLRVCDRILRAVSLQLKGEERTFRKGQDERKAEFLQKEMVFKLERDQFKAGQNTVRNSNAVADKEVRKTTPPAPQAKTPPVQAKPGNSLLNLVPSLDLGLGGLPQLNGKGYDATVKSMAEKILAVSLPS